MTYEICNDILKVRINSKGAELTSIFNISDNLEYLWQGDSTFWKSQAPILFPIVGKLKDNTTIIENKQCTMTNHGIIRNIEPTNVIQDTNTITFIFTYNEETLLQYPYKFEFSITYTLENNKLHNIFNVINHDTIPMYFMYGGHPGFNCPLFTDEQFTDYTIHIDVPSPITVASYKDAVYKPDVLRTVPYNNNEIQLNYDIFKDDALVLKNFNKKTVKLFNKNTNKGVAVHFDDFDYLGIWTTPTANAPYVCLEPWTGNATDTEQPVKFEDKDGMQQLMPNNNYKCTFTIEVL